VTIIHVKPARPIVLYGTNKPTNAKHVHKTATTFYLKNRALPVKTHKNTTAHQRNASQSAPPTKLTTNNKENVTPNSN
jgi:hypothetical protein